MGVALCPASWPECLEVGVTGQAGAASSSGPFTEGHIKCFRALMESEASSVVTFCLYRFIFFMQICWGGWRERKLAERVTLDALKHFFPWWKSFLCIFWFCHFSFAGIMKGGNMHCVTFLHVFLSSTLIASLIREEKQVSSYQLLIRTWKWWFFF